MGTPMRERRPGRSRPLTRSEMMSRIRGRNTGPEVLLRRLLLRRGLRFKINYLTPSGRVDIAFPAVKVAVQVDGCFWHCCPWHCVTPRNNRQFWITKLEGNKSRDRRQKRRLRALGWRLVRVWEHLLESDPEAAVSRVAGVLPAELLDDVSRKRLSVSKGRGGRGSIR